MSWLKSELQINCACAQAIRVAEAYRKVELTISLVHQDADSEEKKLTTEDAEDTEEKQKRNVEEAQFSQS